MRVLGRANFRVLGGLCRQDGTPPHKVSSPEATHHALSGFTNVSFRCLIATWVEWFYDRTALVFQEETRPSLASREGLFTSAQAQRKTAPGGPEAVKVLSSVSADRN